MAHSYIPDTPEPETACAPHKPWMGYALATSLMLHLLAVVFIFAAGGAVRSIPAVSGILVENVTFAPTISPAKQAEPVPAPAPSEPPRQPDASQDVPPLQASSAAQTAAPEKASEGMKELMATPLGLGMTYGYISSLAEGRSLREDIRGYYFEVVEKINREWWKRADGLKEPIRRDGIIELYVQPDGSIISQRIYQGTGSREADQVLQDVIKAVAPLPPLPASFDQKVFLAPLKIKAPSTLFSIK
ncbi:TonB C-terminal domain-containing protein [Oryzomonas sagensis]|uniref:TonB C-terminal domain-containing protein n=1 Tax=Oryzomonas sagensis TaxID=2603857 RepID=A0ABQ6TL11_9BACT|nr:TonB C-terminal domain-containing protein [Oryzomonas sagensis]KAB0668813.1 TonB C-terminal domain-containing protein [Oryzomonas sagensis]